MYPRSARNLSVVGVALLSAWLAACQPGEEEQPVPPGAIPAAPDMRPGTEAAPGGVALPGAQTDSVAGEPRAPVPENQPGADQAPQ
ncbi:MAG: hypothetical protein WD766_08215 [Gemmatimonadota bacterium]